MRPTRRVGRVRHFHSSNACARTRAREIAVEWREISTLIPSPAALKTMRSTIRDFFYGTTLRVYDPGIDGWHILWSDPLRQFYSRQVGRALGPDIVAALHSLGYVCLSENADALGVVSLGVV
jgi:hypothetical protein